MNTPHLQRPLCVLILPLALWGETRAQSIESILPAPGFQFSSATYIAPGGTVVGVSSNSGAYMPRPTRWASVGAPAELLGASPLGGGGEVARCSDDGRVVVGRWAPDSNSVFPVLWGESGAYTQLPTPGPNSVANGVSADGAFTTGWSATSQGRWLLRWENGVLRQQFGPSFLSGPCSPDGRSAIGTTYQGGSAAALSVWRVNGGNGFVQTLAQFPSTWTNINAPADMTPTADAAIGVAYTGNNTYQSWIWRNGQLLDMGLPAGVTSISATSISADGALVAGTALIEVQPNAFRRRAEIWTPETGWRFFEDWLSAQDISFPGWTFNSLNCVSPDGRTFAGQATTPMGEIRGFVVTVPGPGPASALLLGTVIALRRRR